MSRFYTNIENIKGDIIFIKGDEAHHIIDVMRMSEGDRVTIFDGTGNEYTGIIDAIDTKIKSLKIVILETRSLYKVSGPEVTLVQAIPKKQKMDYLVEKATELGVHSVIPIVTDRTIVRPAASDNSKKVERWEKISIAAAKQCGRTDIPIINDICPYRKFIEQYNSFDLYLFASLYDRTIDLKSCIRTFSGKTIAVIIGPEGGFSPEEAALAKLKKYNFISLGNRVLKSDTAGLVVLSVIEYELFL